MGFENMRPGHARCPNYLLVGSLFLCFLLAYNWWSLYAQNYELLERIDEIGEQLAICSDEKTLCSSRKNTLEARTREIEARLAESKLREIKSDDETSKRGDEIASLKSAIEEGKEAIAICRADLESLKRLDASRVATLATMRIDKDALNDQITELKLRVKTLERDPSSFRTTSAAKLPKNPSEPVAIPDATPSSPNPKPPRESRDPPPNDGPVSDGNHESNYGDADQFRENAANEEFDDELPPKKI